MPTSSSWNLAVASGLAIVVLAAGCGSAGSTSSSATTALSAAVSSAVSSAESSGAGGHIVEIDVADSGLKYVKSTATASAGPVVIRSKNPQSLGHDISIRGNGVDQSGEIVTDGGVSMITIANLKPGTYTFFCSVPGHEQAGMKGTLTVS